MNIRTSPREILREYESCVRFNDSIGLYDTVRRNERFYIGEQWDGLDAPDLDKPVLNFLKRVGSYWSELKQMTTLDNLFAKGVLSDALLYLESVPDGYIRNKRAMIERLRAGDPVGERKV